MTIDPADMPYEMWRRRLDKTPSGAPKHRKAVDLLKLFCTRDEASFLSRMPAKFRSANQLARLLRMDARETQRQLDTLIDKLLVGDLDCGDGVRMYAPLQIIPGFWDFTFMRIDDALPMEEIAALFGEYWDTFYPEVLGQGSPTQDFRVMVREESLPGDYTEILDYERTAHFVSSATRIAVGLCSCSSMRMQSGRRICDRPVETCISLNVGADNVLRMGKGRELTKEQAFNVIDECKSHGMVQCGDNVKNQPWYLCNCCRCCCDLFEAMRRYEIKTTVVTSNYLATTNESACTQCGQCSSSCPVDCISRDQRVASVDEGRCIGCGVCVTKCGARAKSLIERRRRVYTPTEFNEKFLAMALERGKLGDQIFFDPNKPSHTVLSALINAFLKMPPVKQIVAAEKLKSRLLARIAGLAIKDFGKAVEEERQKRGI